MESALHGSYLGYYLRHITKPMSRSICTIAGGLRSPTAVALLTNAKKLYTTHTLVQVGSVSTSKNGIMDVMPTVSSAHPEVRPNFFASSLTPLGPVGANSLYELAIVVLGSDTRKNPIKVSITADAPNTILAVISI